MRATGVRCQGGWVSVRELRSKKYLRRFGGSRGGVSCQQRTAKPKNELLDAMVRIESGHGELQSVFHSLHTHVHAKNGWDCSLMREPNFAGHIFWYTVYARLVARISKHTGLRGTSTL